MNHVLSLNPTQKGIACMIFGGLLLTVQDAIAKWLTDAYHPGEIMFYRSIFAFIVIAVLLRREGGVRSLHTRRPGVMLLRSLLAVASAVLIILSFSLLPLADALSVAFASPLIITALSPWLLGEKVGWRRRAAVIIGFLGILLMTKPSGSTLQLAVLVPLCGAVASALRDIVTRHLGITDQAAAILFYTMVATMICGALSLPFGATLPGAFDMVLFAVGGGIHAIANFYLIQALRYAEAVVIAPFKYLALVWAALLGFLVWGDIPDVWLISGSTLVIGSGLYILHRESGGLRWRRNP